jgi:hypothetical protein
MEKEINDELYLIPVLSDGKEDIFGVSFTYFMVCHHVLQG